ncbi:MAG: helix-turn-helix domain-containing protein [Saccharofermentans sp.]|nr:helix-turn-helix domain-containing protein [Saccharofermentans sp.]
MENKIIGENIHRLRENAGFTQSNLAQFIGVDQSLVARIEKGERTISADMLEKLANLFGVTVHQIEDYPISTSKLSFAFRGSEFSVQEMEAIAAINKIALNSEFMRKLLKEGNS